MILNVRNRKLSRCASMFEGTSSMSFGFGVSIILFWVNLFRFHPEFLPVPVSIFWLDAVFVLAGLGLLLIYSRQRIKNSALLVVTLTMFLAAFSLYGGGIDHKYTYVIRIVFIVGALPIVYASWFCPGRDPMKVYSHILAISTIPMSLIVFSQLLSLPVFSDVVHSLWGSEKLRSLAEGNPRVYGAFYNANWFGVYVVIALVSIAYLRAQKLIGLSLVGFYGLLASILLIASGSRTALLGLLTAFSAFAICLVVQRGAVIAARSVCVGLGIILGIATLLTSIVDEGFLKRWHALGSIEDIPGFANRFRSWLHSLERISDNPIVGSGVVGIPHNSYLATLEAFGLLGGMWILSLFAFVIIGACLKIRDREALLSLPIICSFAVMAGTAEFFYTTQIIVLMMPLFLWAIWPFSAGQRNGQSSASLSGRECMT